MDRIEQAIQKMQFEWDVSQMQYIASLEVDIKHFIGRYYEHTNNKAFDRADQVDRIITMYKQELENVRGAFKNSSCEVSSPSATGNKKVFILER